MARIQSLICTILNRENDTWYLFDDLDRRMFLHGKVIPNFQSVYKDEMKPIFFFYELYMLRDVQT